MVEKNSKARPGKRISGREWMFWAIATAFYAFGIAVLAAGLAGTGWFDRTIFLFTLGSGLIVGIVEKTVRMRGGNATRAWAISTLLVSIGMGFLSGALSGVLFDASMAVWTGGATLWAFVTAQIFREYDGGY